MAASKTRGAMNKRQPTPPPPSPHQTYQQALGLGSLFQGLVSSETLHIADINDVEAEGPPSEIPFIVEGLILGSLGSLIRPLHYLHMRSSAISVVEADIDAHALRGLKTCICRDHYRESLSELRTRRLAD